MAKTFAFLKLDLLSLKPYFKTLLIIIAIGLFYGTMTKSATISTFLLTFYALVITTYPFYSCEKNNMDILYATLGISRNKMVIGRYLFAVLLIIFFSILSIGTSFLLSIFNNIRWNLEEFIISIKILPFTIGLIMSVQFPIYFKFGFSKARILAYIIPFGVFMAVALILPKAMEVSTLAAWLGEFLLAFSASNLVLALPFLFLTISCLVSCRIYGRKQI